MRLRDGLQGQEARGAAHPPGAPHGAAGPGGREGGAGRGPCLHRLDSRRARRPFWEGRGHCSTAGAAVPAEPGLRGHQPATAAGRRGAEARVRGPAARRRGARARRGAGGTGGSAHGHPLRLTPMCPRTWKEQGEASHVPGHPPSLCLAWSRPRPSSCLNERPTSASPFYELPKRCSSHMAALLTQQAPSTCPPVESQPCHRRCLHASHAAGAAGVPASNRNPPRG